MRGGDETQIGFANCRRMDPGLVSHKAVYGEFGGGQLPRGLVG